MPTPTAGTTPTSRSPSPAPTPAPFSPASRPTPSPATTVTGEGAGQSVTNSGDCVDNAGNAASSATVGGINIDKTAPVISGSRDPEANANGWNNTDVTVSFTCADSGSVQSGIATDTVAGDTLTSEGAGQSVTNSGACVDNAGNAASSATVGGINIDKTRPQISRQP